MERRAFIASSLSVLAAGLVPSVAGAAPVGSDFDSVFDAYIRGEVSQSDVLEAFGFPKGSVILIPSDDNPVITASGVNAMLEKHYQPGGLVILSGLEIDGDDTVCIPDTASRVVVKNCAFTVREGVETALSYLSEEGALTNVGHGKMFIAGNVFMKRKGSTW